MFKLPANNGGSADSHRTSAGMIGMERFDRDILMAWAREAEPWRAVSFMAACTERMLPNYRLFFDEERFGNPQVLREVVDRTWLWAERGEPLIGADTLIAACEGVTPHTEEHSSRYTSAALDAAVATALSLEATVAFDAAKAVEVASLGRDTVDLWVQQIRDLDPLDPALELKILQDPLMQTELQAQSEDRKSLSDRTLSRRAIVTALRDRWRDISAGSLHESLR
jgi:uncharacterized protein YjaG (DUF416 family)